MPIVNIKYNNKEVPDSDIQILAIAIKDIVTETTGIPEVLVYADSPKIQVGTAPIEIFIEISASKVENIDNLMDVTISRIKEWKNESGFNYPVTLTITPMNWKFEVGI